MSYIFKNATILSPVEGIDKVGTLCLSEGGVIEDVVFSGEKTRVHFDDKVFDFTGKVIATGFLDMHVHFREPGFEYKETIETGSRSAVSGGYTAVALMPNTEPPTDNAQVVSFIQKKAEGLSIDVLPIGTITLGRKGEKIANYGELWGAGVRAISDDGSPVMNSQTMRLAFEYASQFDLLVIQHCEDSCLSAGGVMNEGLYSSVLGLRGIPTISESTVIARDISMLRYLQEKKGKVLKNPLRYHVAHISTKAGVELVRQAKKEGLNVTAEVTPHHFTLTDEDVFKARFDGDFKMNPPLRTREDKDAIIAGIADGTIDCIATDHAPHAVQEKECGFNQAAFGIVGLETAVGLTFTELVHKKVISMKRAVEMLSANPRKLLSLQAIKLEKGVQANLSFVDPGFKWEVEKRDFVSKSQNTPFEKRKLIGRSIGIASKGRIVLFNFDSVGITCSF